MERFWEFYFINNMEPDYVIPYPEIVFTGKPQTENGMLESFQNSVDALSKSIAKTYKANNVAVGIANIGLPQKVRQRYANDWPHEYAQISCSWNEGVEIYVTFCKEDSQDIKDAIVEHLLSGIHGKFGCLWERDTNENSTRFRTDIDEVKVTITMYDTLGCFIETIEEDRVLSDYEKANLVEQADGTFVSADAIIRRNAQGKLVRKTKRIKANCSGQPGD